MNLRRLSAVPSNFLPLFSVLHAQIPKKNLDPQVGHLLTYAAPKCTADIGWVTGHSYVVYGTLSLGGTTLMF
ncbi:MAG: hypothetical protein LAO19_20065, partial [Acidobacteriia bacterium]|nr:hypothetical protein [Terriglobia bacterium]